jgi:hypothetical protein
MITAVQMSLWPIASAGGGISAASAPGTAAETSSSAAPATQPASGSTSPSNLFSPAMLQQLLEVQSQPSATTNAAAAGTSVTSASGGAGQTQADDAVDALITLGAKQAASGQVSLGDPYKSTLFNVASGDSGGELTQSELQQSVIAGGGTAQDADALFDQLDPSGTGSVSETQMASQLATPVSGDTFGNGLADYLNGKESAGDLQQSLLQQLMGIGLTQNQANSLALQMKSAGLA